MHKEYDIPLISTTDSHYFSPDVWKDRELYKRLRPGATAFFGERYFEILWNSIYRGQPSYGQDDLRSSQPSQD